LRISRSAWGEKETKRNITDFFKKKEKEKEKKQKKDLFRGPFPFPTRRPMQSLVLHPPSLTTSQFGQPRFNSGPERLPLNRSWSPNARGCSPRAHLRQSMSGSPEPEPSAKPLGHPSPVAAERSVPVSELSQVPVTEPLRLPYSEQGGPLYTGSPRLPGAPTYPLPVLDQTHPTGRSLAQKSTRRTKAHVASACVNCKKKHLGCDPARPCRRCVLAGKAVSV